MTDKLRITSTALGATVLAGLASAYVAWGQFGPTRGSLEAAEHQRQLLERGKYVVAIAGCNDCHTPGYGETGGKVPVQQWLTGGKLGFHGPWGTTYSPNLRLLLQARSEAEWVEQAKTLQTRPPMPWWALNAMTDTDLRAVYQFIRSLGPAGEPAPDYLPPGVAPATPHIRWPVPPK